MSDNCYKPTRNNPMGNHLPFSSPTKEKTCDTQFSENLNLLYSNYMNKNNTNEQMNFDETFKYNFNTNPVTTSYPDSIELAKYLFADPARCRNTGYLCKINADSTLNLDRLAYYPNEQYYQNISPNPVPKDEFKIGMY